MDWAAGGEEFRRKHRCARAHVIPDRIDKPPDRHDPVRLQEQWATRASWYIHGAGAAGGARTAGVGRRLRRDGGYPAKVA